MNKISHALSCLKKISRRLEIIMSKFSQLSNYKRAILWMRVDSCAYSCCADTNTQQPILRSFQRQLELRKCCCPGANFLSKTNGNSILQVRAPALNNRIKLF